MPDHDPVYKVTIIPRGRALGVTMFLPEEDRYSYSKQRLMSQMKSLYGGRLAEELVFGPAYVTTGASNDIERATDIARNMVTKWGLSDRLGPLTYTEDDGEIFLGRSVTRHKQVSDVTAHAIDEEVRLLIDTCYSEAKRILESNRDKLDLMAAALLEVRDDRRARRSRTSWTGAIRGRRPTGTSRPSPARSCSAESPTRKAPRRSADPPASTSRRLACSRRSAAASLEAQLAREGFR